MVKYELEYRFENRSEFDETIISEMEEILNERLPEHIKGNTCNDIQIEANRLLRILPQAYNWRCVSIFIHHRRRIGEANPVRVVLTLKKV